MNKQFVPKKAMFIFSHPDDIEFVAGGAAAYWASRGAELIYVLVTDGNVGSHDEGMTVEKLIETRRSEQWEAAMVAGASHCEFLGYHDGIVELTLDLRKELVRLIRIHRPDAVVTTDPTSMFENDTYINHPDHRATATAALEAVYPSAALTRLYPDLAAEGLEAHCVDHVFVRNDSQANFYIDISGIFDLKIEALMKHKSQFVGWDPRPMVEEWDAATGKMIGLQYAEGYRHISLCDRRPFPD
jgi:LmbE family N-acetylglucosaminyl deacetylase